MIIFSNARIRQHNSTDVRTMLSVSVYDYDPRYNRDLASGATLLVFYTLLC